MQRQESFAIVENEYRTLQKKVDEWGGEDQVNMNLNRIKLLVEKNETLEKKVKEQESQIVNQDSEKGLAMLSALQGVSEDDIETTKSKKELLDELAQKTNDILALKQELEEVQVQKNQMQEEVVHIRESQLGRKSSEGMDSSNPFDNAQGKKIDFEEYEEVSRNLEESQSEVRDLEKQLEMNEVELEKTKSKFRDMLIAKEKELKQSFVQEQQEEAKAPSPEKQDDHQDFLQKMLDQATIDYLRNVFVKYLIYLARKGEKETKTLEKVLYTVLNIPPEQQRRIARARKRSTFWQIFKRKSTKKDKKTPDEDGLDKDINFSMTTESEADFGMHMNFLMEDHQANQLSNK